MTELSSQPRLELLPAVDVADGKAVRLTQGEAGTETSYGSPVDAALDWIEQGAEWIHLVDLDAAFGRGSNAALLRKVIKQNRMRRQRRRVSLSVQQPNTATARVTNLWWRKCMAKRSCWPQSSRSAR